VDNSMGCGKWLLWLITPQQTRKTQKWSSCLLKIVAGSKHKKMPAATAQYG
jgi:hypothetical protein